jgi:hypothetical protein
MATPLPPEWSAWVDEGARLLSAPPLRRNEQAARGRDDPKFALGDFLVTIPALYVEMLAEHLNRDPAQLRGYRDVAEKIPPNNRVNASWTVHRDLRDRTDLLRDRLTVRDAAALLGKKPIDAKPDRRLSLEERAAKVRGLLADADVRAVIEAELTEGRAGRTARKLASRIVSEHSQRKRDLEAELRALRSAMSPLEATVKAELQINESTQLVEAIAKSVDDLHEPERVVSALADLQVLIDSFLLTRTPTATGTDAVIIDADEVWQTRPARATLVGSNQRDLSKGGRVVIDLEVD